VNPIDSYASFEPSNLVSVTKMTLEENQEEHEAESIKEPDKI